LLTGFPFTHFFIFGTELTENKIHGKKTLLY
jgi:hypothetical protein